MTKNSMHMVRALHLSQQAAAERVRVRLVGLEDKTFARDLAARSRAATVAKQPASHTCASTSRKPPTHITFAEEASAGRPIPIAPADDGTALNRAPRLLGFTDDDRSTP